MTVDWDTVAALAVAQAFVAIAAGVIVGLLANALLAWLGVRDDDKID